MPDWKQEAACRGVDPELFFPIGNTGSALLQIDEAKQVCRSCPVLSPCLDWALAVGEVGVWGGTTPEERKTIELRRTRAAQRATATA